MCWFLQRHKVADVAHAKAAASVAAHNVQGKTGKALFAIKIRGMKRLKAIRRKVHAKEVAVLAKGRAKYLAVMKRCQRMLKKLKQPKPPVKH